MLREVSSPVRRVAANRYLICLLKEIVVTFSYYNYLLQGACKMGG